MLHREAKDAEQNHRQRFGYSYDIRDGLFRAVIDLVSEASFMSENVVQMLKLPKQKISAGITGTGG